MTQLAIPPRAWPCATCGPTWSGTSRDGWGRLVLSFLGHPGEDPLGLGGTQASNPPPRHKTFTTAG